MELLGAWFLPVVWTCLGVTIVVSALRASLHDRAFAVGIAAVSVLWVLAGAAVNAAMLADGSTYSGFADGSPVPFVRDTWESLVVPHHHLFIGLLIAGEAVAGLLVLVPGRVRRATLLALVGFNATLVVFGWAFGIWAVPLVIGLSLLYRADEVRNPRRRPCVDGSVGHHRSPRSRVPSP